jgi:hypothetical protein
LSGTRPLVGARFAKTSSLRVHLPCFISPKLRPPLAGGRFIFADPNRRAAARGKPVRARQFVPEWPSRICRAE